MLVLFTAPCPSGHRDARWSQRQTTDITAVRPEHFDIACQSCDATSLPTSALSPVALPPVTPLVLRGYRWVRSAVAS